MQILSEKDITKNTVMVRERNNGWCDLHCHVLPGIDDGCQTCEESIQVLKAAAAQGVYGMVATPHYYPKESIRAFLRRRDRSAERLHKKLEQSKEAFPRLCYGAEATYHAGLVYDDDLELLCMGNSRFLLLELPFSAWAPSVLRDIREVSGQGIIPIIAHVERYLDFQTKKTAQELFEADVLIQANAGALVGAFKGRNVRNLLQHRQIDVLSSDCHNLTSRPPNLGVVTSKLLAKGRLRDEIETIRQQNNKIFEAAEENTQ